MSLTEKLFCMKVTSLFLQSSLKAQKEVQSQLTSLSTVEKEMIEDVIERDQNWQKQIAATCLIQQQAIADHSASLPNQQHAKPNEQEVLKLYDTGGKWLKYRKYIFNYIFNVPQFIFYQLIHFSFFYQHM